MLVKKGERLQVDVSKSSGFNYHNLLRVTF